MKPEAFLKEPMSWFENVETEMDDVEYKIKTIFESILKIYEDVVLPSDIQLPEKYEKELSQCKTVFLTGAAGFLGVYLVQSYLEQTDMRHYELWKDAYENRIVAIPGELKSEKLGMSDK